MQQNKKKIKINFCGFWSSFDKNKNLFTNILRKHFNIEICDNPDYVICSNRGAPFEYMKYDCVRIMFMGENMSPDFTVFDYCIGFDFLDFGDRYFRLPFAFYNDNGEPLEIEMLNNDKAEEILRQKKYFANFIYGHSSSNGMRELLFNKLNQYKTVISPGSYLNNISQGKIRRCSWKEKNEYLKLSKFTIAGDSISYPGFVTEKIIDPLKNHSIPIYCGSPLIDKDFNIKAFIWCKGKNDIERTIAEVEYIDSHNDAYIAMLCQYPFNSLDYLKDKYIELEKFLLNIFLQEPESARRRVRYFCADEYEKYLKNYAVKYERTPHSIRKLSHLWYKMTNIAFK